LATIVLFVFEVTLLSPAVLLAITTSLTTLSTAIVTSTIVSLWSRIFLIIVGVVAAETYLAFDFVDGGLGLGVELLVLGLGSHVVLSFNYAVVLGELGFAFSLFNLAFQLKSVAKGDKLFVASFNLLELSGWRNLKSTKLLQRRVVQVNTVFLLVVEGGGTVPIALLLVLLLLELVQGIASGAVSLGLSDLNLAFLNIFLEFFSASFVLSFRLGIRLLGLFLVGTIALLLSFFAVFGAEVDQLLA